MSIQIIPTPLYPIPPMIDSFRYTVNTLELNSYIIFNVIPLDINGTPLKVEQVTIAGEDYLNWGNNDQYVINYICTSLGYTLATPSNVSTNLPIGNVTV